MVLFLAGTGAAIAADVKVWEEPLVIPTYELGPPNPTAPMRFGPRRVNATIYPYTQLESLTRHRVAKPYHAVYLENEYLRVTVLPEHGGKLYSIYDKTAKREVLYTNHVMKYALVGLRGAWTSGGIEWNFPNGHTVSAVSPVDYVVRNEAGGAASVTVGETERIQRMHWAVTIRLRPGVKAVETEVRLNNRRELPGHYWYWATAAAPATNDLRFVYPMREAYPHSFWPVYSFPMHEGVDVGTYREVGRGLSLFARNSLRDYMGIYYEKADHGVVHVADHKLLPGKKTWTWGNAADGQRWVDWLTDNDGQYVEFQAGRPPTQMEHDFFPPRTQYHFTEYWFPVAGLGGPFDEANQNGALRAARGDGGLKLTVNVNAACVAGEVRATAGDQTLASIQTSLDPTRPFGATVPLPAGTGEKPVAILVRCGGRTLLSYRTDMPIDGNPDFQPATPPPPLTVDPKSAQASVVAAEWHEKDGQEMKACSLYQEAIQRDPSSPPGHLGLAACYYRAGEYDKAAERLNRVVLQDPANGEARFRLALVRRAQGRLADAVTALRAALEAGFRESLGRALLGEVLLGTGDSAGAASELAASARLDPSDSKARTYLAMAERLAGRLPEAEEHITAVSAEMPLDGLVRREEELILTARGKKEQAARASTELWRMLEREPDSAVELALDYMAVRQYAEASALLADACQKVKYPVVQYALGYAYGMLGDTQRATTAYAEGAALSPAYVFPHRPEEIEIFRAARAANPNDGRAAYYLGNAFLGANRPAEAASAWRDAVRLDPGNAAAHRNLGAMLWDDSQTRKEAAAEYERAVAAAPDEPVYYAEAIRAIADSDAKIKLLERAPAGVRAQPQIIQALAGLYGGTHRLEDAIRLLDTTEFPAAEGDAGVYRDYHETHMAMAREHQKYGDHSKAGAEMMRALDPPRTLGYLPPANVTPARDLVAAGREFELGKKRAEAENAWRRAADGPLPRALSYQHYFKAVALEKLGRRDEAQALYARLASADKESDTPAGAERKMLIGLGLKGLGRATEARAALEEAIAENKRLEVAKEQLAELKPEEKGRR